MNLSASVRFSVRPPARLREGPGRAPLRHPRHGPGALGVPDGRPRARPRARDSSDQRGRPGRSRPSGPGLAPRGRASEAAGTRPRAMTTLYVGTLLRAGGDPAAGTRAISPTAELPWRT